MVVNALDMAIRNRSPKPGAIVHADHGTQFTSWVFGEKIRSAGLVPSFGTVGDGLDNAIGLSPVNESTDRPHGSGHKLEGAPPPTGAGGERRGFV